MDERILFSFPCLLGSFFFFPLSVTKRGHAHADHVGCSQVIAYLWAARACGPSMSPQFPALFGSFLASTMLEDIPFFSIPNHRERYVHFTNIPLPLSPTSSILHVNFVDIIHNWPRKFNILLPYSLRYDRFN